VRWDLLNTVEAHRKEHMLLDVSTNLTQWDVESLGDLGNS
jgi:MoaA/NifB/PqqE/SkfB family radical SAM enzyme